MAENSGKSAGVGCLGLLAIMLTTLFVGLKLTGHIGWDWVWVVSPLWIALSLGVVGFIVALSVIVLIIWIKGQRN